MTNWKNLAGFTLIELIAGIAAITAVAINFLPAVQR
jgi:prepilin-type N-terminal cleavage/methylation domain-containing protein